MKNTLLRNGILLILLFTSGIFSCKKAGKLTPLDISGVLYTDYLGNPIGTYGNTADDWQITASLSPPEMNLFNFPDSVDMNGTVQISNVKIFPAYPNPAKSYIGFVGQFGLPSQTSKLKVVITDPFYNIALQDAILVNGTEQFFFSLANFAYQKGGIYRIYYSLSSKDKPNYKVGYGDFQICPGNIPLPNCP